MRTLISHCAGLISPLAETAVPYTAFKEAGFDVAFATESGKTPSCDSRMLEGITQKILVRALRTRRKHRAY